MLDVASSSPTRERLESLRVVLQLLPLAVERRDGNVQHRKNTASKEHLFSTHWDTRQITRAKERKSPVCFSPLFF